MRYVFIVLVFISSLYSDEVMVSKMQSAVDEVIELRKNYESSVKDLSTCRNSLKKQSKDMTKISKNEGIDYKEFEKNREQLVQLRRANINLVKDANDLDAKNKNLTKELKELKTKNKTLQDENIKLAYNIDRLRQTDGQKWKKNKEVKQTKKKITKVKKTKKVKTKKINKKKETKQKQKQKIKKVVNKKSGTFRLNKKAKIYNKIDGKEISVWEEKTSFTSNKIKTKWIKITGHFVNKKWQPSKQEMWIKVEDTVRR